jgi:AcrR family transcriptional regulator
MAVTRPPVALGSEASTPTIHLIRTAYRLFAARGVHRVSLEHIAAEARVSKGIVLYYFKTRENLVLATMEWVLSHVAEQIRQATGRSRTPAGNVRAMLDVIFASPESNRQFYLTYLDLVGHASRVRRFGELSASFRAIINGLYAEMIRAGVRQKAFRVADVEEAAVAVRAIIEGLFLQWLQEERWEALHSRYKQRAKAAVLTYLRAP